MKHSGPFHSDDDGMQHEGHLCQLTRERSFLQPEVGMRMTAVHPAHEDCPMPCSALHTRYCYCVQSSLHPSRQELPWGAKKLGYLPRSSGQQEASQDSNPCLVQPRPTSTVSEHIACGVSEFIGQGLYRVCEEISYLTESRKSKLTEQVKPSAMSMCFSCVGYEAGQLSNLFLLS